MTGCPFSSTRNSVMKCAGTSVPVASSLRRPVSIGCSMSIRTSVLSRSGLVRIFIVDKYHPTLDWVTVDMRNRLQVEMTVGEMATFI